MPTDRSQPASIIRRLANGRRSELTDTVSTELPLEIRVRGQGIAITMRTPGHDRELAAGFALSEGLITHPQHLLEVEHCRREEAEHSENIINLFIDATADCNIENLTRHVVANSSCGICGKATLEAVQKQWPPIESEFTVPSQLIMELPSRVQSLQSEFQQTGGIHAAALLAQDGSVICVREDVGRHNAVDKVIGWSVLNGAFPLKDSLLFVSSRASFEIMQKALAAHIPVVAAVSAPSSLAGELAQSNQQTLIGFLRDTSFNIYSHSQRVLD